MAADCHKIIVMSGGKEFGVDFFVDRYNGIMDGMQAARDRGYDIEMVYEVLGWPGTEAFAAHGAAALETDADGLAGTLTALMWIQPMQNAGKFGLSIPMILNAVDGFGHLQRSADGGAPRVLAKNWVVTNAEDLAYYAGIEKDGGTWTFDIEDIKSVLGAFNPDLNVDQMSALYSAVTVDEIRARRA